MGLLALKLGIFWENWNYIVILTRQHVSEFNYRKITQMIQYICVYTHTYKYIYIHTHVYIHIYINITTGIMQTKLFVALILFLATFFHPIPNSRGARSRKLSWGESGERRAKNSLHFLPHCCLVEYKESLSSKEQISSELDDRLDS